MEILKPCPFCSSKARLFTAFGTIVECEKCGAKIYDFTEEKAIKKWNRRVIVDIASSRKS